MAKERVNPSLSEQLDARNGDQETDSERFSSIPEVYTSSQSRKSKRLYSSYGVEQYKKEIAEQEKRAEFYFEKMQQAQDPKREDYYRGCLEKVDERLSKLKMEQSMGLEKELISRQRRRLDHGRKVLGMIASSLVLLVGLGMILFMPELVKTGIIAMGSGLTGLGLNISVLASIFTKSVS